MQDKEQSLKKQVRSLGKQLTQKVEVINAIRTEMNKVKDELSSTGEKLTEHTKELEKNEETAQGWRKRNCLYEKRPPSRSASRA